MNTFGTASTKYPLYDPRSVRADRQRFRRDALPDLMRANAFYAPGGRLAARGWVLIRRGDYDNINKYSTDLQLEIDDPRQPNNVGTIKSLSIVWARCVTTGVASDPNALYLVELTDDRGILHNQWFQAPTTSAYNIRAPGYPQTFHPGSMNGGTTWTWSTMLQNLWQQMTALGSGALLNAWPGLPSTPTGTPEGFWLIGVPAWGALNDILDHLGFVVAYDPTSATPYTIVDDGIADAALTALQTKYATRLEDEAAWIDTGSGRAPATVTVLFRRRNSVYGTEETVRYDTLQWDMTTNYSVVGNAPSMFNGAVGADFVWSDFTVRYDQDGVPFTEDTTAAAAIAAELVTQYYSRIYGRTLGSLQQVYTGALPFTTGSQVDGVRWYMDHNKDRAGWCTEIVRGTRPPWPEVGE